MLFLSDAEFGEVFRTFARSAFHLEVEDTYRIAEESEPLQRFLSGKPDDFAWHRGWLDMVRTRTTGGRRIERVRVVTVPHTDYTRWGLTIATLNVAAGEDIRWLPRHLTGGLDVSADDFWLFDRSRVFFTAFTPEGSFAGAVETVDPVVVARCVQMRDALWPRATPHDDYLKGPR